MVLKSLPRISDSLPEFDRLLSFHQAIHEREAVVLSQLGEVRVAESWRWTWAGICEGGILGWEASNHPVERDD